MKKSLLIYLISILSLILFITDAHALTYPYATGYGARATAMGGAFSAVADDPSAVFYNPAGLAKLKGTHLTTAPANISPDLWYEDSGEPRADDPMESMVYPLFLVSSDLGTESFVFGLGASLPYGDIYDLRQGKYARDEHLPWRFSWYRQELNRFIVYPAVGWQVTPNLSVGAGFGLDMLLKIDPAELALLGAIDAVALVLMDIQGILAGEALMDMEKFDINIKRIEVTELDLMIKIDSICPQLGLLWEPTEKLGVALVHHSETKDTIIPLKLVANLWAEVNLMLSVMGIDIRLPVDPIELPLSKSTTVYEHRFPQQGVIGLSYKPLDRLTLASDLLWTDWSIISEDYGSWEDTYAPRFGLEYRLGPMTLPFVSRFLGDINLLSLRAGYFHEPSPIPDSANANSFVEFDRDVYSGGIGLSFLDHTLTLDFYYQRSVLEERRVTTQNRDFIGGGSMDALGFAATLRF